MSLTLGTLRTFCREIASPDSSGSTAEREFMVWINAAIQRVYSAAGWDRILHQQKITVLPRESLTSLVVTEGSTAITCVAPDTFRPSASTKYLDDLWELHIEGESDEVFLLDAIASDTSATLRDGDEWTSDSDTGLTVYFVKTAYDLPDTAKQIHRVYIVENRADLTIVSPQDFDLLKHQNPTHTGVYPRYAAFRGGKVEIWPHPGDSYCKLLVSYRKGPTVLGDSDLDATVIDWDDEWRDLLQRAIQLEASITQAENSPVPYAIAKAEFERRLSDYLALNVNKDPQTGPMGLTMPAINVPYGSPAETNQIDYP